MFFDNEYLKLKPLMDVGNGHVLSTDYESYSVALDRSMVAEEGTLTFVDPGNLNSGDRVSIEFRFWDVTWTQNQREFMADVGSTANIVMPTPMPANVAEYLADAFRRHHVFLANAVTSLTANTIPYRVIRPGIELQITSPQNAVIRQTTATASNGSVPNVGEGGALFYRPEMNNLSTPTITPIRATVGLAADGPIMFYGVLRRDQAQDFQFGDNNLCLPKHAKCAEAVRRGKIQVPIETPIAGGVPNNPEIHARYLADGVFANTGGFRVVQEGTPPETGMIKVSNGELYGVYSQTSIAIYLR